MVSAPMIAYPHFDQFFSEFNLHPYANAIGTGEVFEQDGYVIAYASYSLTYSEWQYSECLAINHICNEEISSLPS